MRKFSLAAAVVLTALLLVPAAALAGQGHGFDDHEGPFSSGVTCLNPVLDVDNDVNAPVITIGPFDVNGDGVNDLISQVWVKGGNNFQATVVFTDGNTKATITGSDGTKPKDISHYDVSICVASGGGGDDTAAAATTGGGDDTAAAATTGGGGAGGGGGGGAGGGGGSGELPFTGLPILIPLLLGGALLGSGMILLRRGRQQD